MTTQIKLRRDTAANWSANSTVVLAAGEPGFETDTGKLKIGNGTNTWASLGYCGGDITSLINGSYTVSIGNDGKLSTNNTTITSIDLRDTTGRGFYTGNDGYTLRSNGSNNWIFGTDGTLTIPTGSKIKDGNNYLTTSNLEIQGSLKGVDGSTGTTGQVLTRQSNGGVAWANSTGGGGGSSDRLTSPDGDIIVTLDNSGTLTLPDNNAQIITPSAGSGNKNIDIFTNNWDGGGVEVYLQHNNSVGIFTANGDHMWIFDKYGVLTLPQGTELAEKTWSSAIASITTGATTFVTLTDNEFDYPETGQITITGVLGATELNRTWYYQASNSDQLELFAFEDRVATVDSTGWGAYTTGTGTVTLVTETVLTVNNNTWKFSRDGSTTFPGGKQVSFDENNNTYIASAGEFPWHSDGLNLVGSANNAVTITALDTNVVNDAKFNSWNFNLDGTLQLPNSAIQADSANVVCSANADTIIFTGSPYATSIKLLIKVEGSVSGSTWDAQSCEMIVARAFRANTVVASVYAVVHTSADPLATFTAQWNNTTGRVEVLCRPTSSTYGVEVKTFATEITTSD